MPINVGLIAPAREDGTSFYRAVGPYSYLAREYDLVLDDDNETREWDWTHLMKKDCMVIQRPFTAPHAMVAKTCKALNVPLIVDYDDLYSSFPNWCQGQQRLYGSKEALACMDACLRYADVVTVSTEALGRELAPKTKRVEVIPNAFNSYIWPLEPEKTGRRKVVTWRGSGGHVGDLEPVIEELRAFKHAFPDWELHFLGDSHYKCAELGTLHPKEDIISYMWSFRDLRPSIHIVPLTDCLFNRCKSNIAWLEATAAGAATIAPLWQEWQQPGVTHYAGEGGLSTALCQMAALSAQDRERRWQQSYDAINANLRLSVVNRKRAALIKELTSR